jgi:hypothetical protein
MIKNYNKFGKSWNLPMEKVPVKTLKAHAFQKDLSEIIDNG